MDLIELGAVLGDFFEGGAGPSHDELDRAIDRAGLGAGDPAPASGSQFRVVGKTKRVRQLMVYATDQDPRAGLAMCRELVQLLRADGMFSGASTSYAGAAKIQRLREAFDRLGFALDGSGGLAPKVIDNLVGTDLGDALQAIVSRINLNPDDAALQIGSGKELDEAAARHVLMERLGDYPVTGPASGFPVTLAQAFNLLGMEVAPNLRDQLSKDPYEEVQQCLFMLAVAVNGLRNDVGTGHGRPDGRRKTRPMTDAEARLVARATALVAGLLLDSV
jgi:hypothetical protein